MTRKLTFPYSLIMAFYWANFAVLLNYASVYLLGRGLPNTSIGLLISAASLLAAAAQPLLGSYADRPESPSVKKLLLIGCLCFLLLAAGIIFSADVSSPLLIVTYTLAITVMQSMMTLTNALGTVSARAGHRVNFGIARGIGSLAYALVSLAIGSAAARLGNEIIPLVSIVLYAALFLCVLPFPFKKPETPPKSASLRKPFLRRYPAFSIVLAASVCLYTSHSLLNNFMFQILSSKGGGSEALGISSAVGALVEIPMMFLFARLLRRIPVRRWMIISGFAFLLKSIGSLLVPNVYGFYAVQTLQLFAFAVLAVASVYYADECMAPEDAVKGQAFLAMTSTVGSVIASATGGWLIDSFGIPVLLGVSIAASALGAVIMYLGIDIFGKKPLPAKKF